MKKAFTLVELIVVITILAILGTIAFISLQGYSKEARDSKRVQDVRSLISKLNIENVKGTPYEDMLTDKEEYTKQIDGVQNPVVNGIIDFEYLRESEKNFKDPEYGIDYDFASAVGIAKYNSKDQSYNFIEGRYWSEKNNKEVIMGNYYKYQPSDDEHLFSGSINITKPSDGGGTSPQIEIWTDPKTGFKWELNPPVGKEGALQPGFTHFVDMNAYCASLGSDWRMPTKNEIYSLISYDTTNSKGAYTRHPNISPSEMWANTQVHSMPSFWWRINFSSIHMLYDWEGFSWNAICINSTGTKPNNWIDNPDTDAATRFGSPQTYGGLINNAYKDSFLGNKYWQANPDSVQRTFTDAKAYCEALGDGAWRLPTIDELYSITTYTLKNSNNLYTVHPNLGRYVDDLDFDYSYWASTLYAPDNAYIRLVLFDKGEIHTSKLSLGYKNNVVCIHD